MSDHGKIHLLVVFDDLEALSSAEELGFEGVPYFFRFSPNNVIRDKFDRQVFYFNRAFSLFTRRTTLPHCSDLRRILGFMPAKW